MPLSSKSFDAVKRLWPAMKWGVFLLVLVFVIRHGWKLWARFDPVATPLHWGWLALAIVISQIAWIPSLWYWRELMAALGAPAPWPQAARAYYCGTLGKYLPGKGVAIVIRSAMLKDCGVPGATAALTVVIETLTFVWVGTLLALVLYPTISPHLPPWIGALAGSPILRWCLLAAVACGGLFAFAAMMRSHRPLANWFHRRPEPSASPLKNGTGFEPPSQTAEEFKLPETPVPLTQSEARSALGITLAGLCTFVAAWWMQGLTLGLTIHAVSAEPWNWNDWPFWTGTAAVALVGGFVAFFAPGGLGVREGLLIELLESQLGPREAVLVALLLRGVSLAGEILAAAAFYYGVAASPNDTRKQTVPRTQLKG